MILNCNPPQSSMQPIIHWMDSSECISPPFLPPLHTSCHPNPPHHSVCFIISDGKQGPRSSDAASVSYIFQWRHGSATPFEPNSFFCSAAIFQSPVVT